MTPDSQPPDSEASESFPRPSRRAVVLGVIGALVATVAVAAVGFLAAPIPRETPSPDAGGISTQDGQLGTLPLHDEKGMRAIAKGVPGTATASPTPAATPTATSTASP